MEFKKYETQACLTVVLWVVVGIVAVCTPCALVINSPGSAGTPQLCTERGKELT